MPPSLKKTKQLLCLLLCISCVITRGHESDTWKFPDNLDSLACPLGWEDHPLILVSVDGFRSDYLTRGLTPTIEEIALKGVRTPFVKPSFPSVTFPNHYTIVTMRTPELATIFKGLLPAYHGIVDNKMYDPELDSYFSIKSKESLLKKWWHGEPIWKTASKQVLSWLDLPKTDRPDFIALYMHEPDGQGHLYGPDSVQVDDALKHVDSIILRLMRGLEEKGLLACVNLIILADHGMAAAGEERVIHLKEIFQNFTSLRQFGGIFARTHVPLEQMELVHRLVCLRPELRVYLKEDLPLRWHMSNQKRVENVVLELDSGYQVDFDGTYKSSLGIHGYDYYFASMNALFVAFGPEIKRDIEVESFQNIEIYNLMCSLLNIDPAPNNGTIGSLEHLLVHPKNKLSQIKLRSIPKIMKLSLLEETIETVSSRENDSRNYSGETDDYAEEIVNKDEYINRYLGIKNRQIPLLMEKHLPFGSLEMGRFLDETRLVIQPDFITAYSMNLQMPLWSSFTLQKWSNNYKHKQFVLSPIKGDLLSNNRTARSIEVGFHEKYTLEYLFHPDFSSSMLGEFLTRLSSNTVLMSAQLIKRYRQLRSIIKGWLQQYETLNVVTGLAFDEDKDSFADDIHNFRSSNNTKLPTHIYTIVTRCLKKDKDSLSECPPEYLDVMAFVFPQTQVVSNCLDGEAYAQIFSAKVSDVEKISGMQFYTKLQYKDAVRLRLRIHSSIWGKEIWENRFKTKYFGLRK